MSPCRWIGMLLSAALLDITTPSTCWQRFWLSVLPLVLVRLHPDHRQHMGEGKAWFKVPGTRRQGKCLGLVWRTVTCRESLQRNKKIHSEHLKAFHTFWKCLGHQGAYIPWQSITVWLGVPGLMSEKLHVFCCLTDAEVALQLQTLPACSVSTSLSLLPTVFWTAT